MKLLKNALIKYISGLILVGALLFLPAGDFMYTNAWLFICLLFVPMLVLGIVLFLKSPELLQKRLSANEGQKTQRLVVKLSALIFLVGFVVAGFDYRFKWTQVPAWAVAIASVILILSYGMYAEVMRENAYLSRTIEVSDGQKVVDTGLYGVVRHPMYLATVILFLTMPVVLGSWLSLVCFLPYIPIIAVRIINEEKLLKTELNGYADYCKRVKYRLIPFLW